jgi:hypothetical protein
MGNASLLNEIIRKSTSLIDPTYRINKAILYSGNNDVYHSAKKFVRVLADKLKINADPILYSPFAKIPFPPEFQVISNTYIPGLYFLILSTIEVTNGIRHTYTPQTAALLCCWVRLQVTESVYRQKRIGYNVV